MKKSARVRNQALALVLCAFSAGYSAPPVYAYCTRSYSPCTFEVSGYLCLSQECAECSRGDRCCYHEYGYGTGAGSKGAGCEENVRYYAQICGGQCDKTTSDF